MNASINKVWDFYTDVNHLQVITPPEMKLRILRSTHQKLVQGSEVWLTGILVTRSDWHSRITSLIQYEYVDEMLSGRFKVWKHLHGFHRIGECTTEVIDKIDFELHHGFFGRMFEGYVHSKLDRIFAHRKLATIKALEN